MRFKRPWVEGRFLARENRFRALVEVGGRRVRAHVPNSGRLREILFRGNRVLLARAGGAGRKTAFDLLMAYRPPGRGDRASSSRPLRARGALENRPYRGARSHRPPGRGEIPRSVGAPLERGAQKSRLSRGARSHRGRQLVSIDARLPNDLVEEALREGRLPEFSPYRLILREVRQGGSRFDFLLMAPRSPGQSESARSVESPAGKGGSKEPASRLRPPGPRPSSGSEHTQLGLPERLFLEVKSVTLVEGGTALFPDAPSARGARHLRELARHVRRGKGRVGGAVLFCVQRPDALHFAPHVRADPDFARALDEARRAGVRVFAYTCRVSRRAISLQRPLPVDLGP